MTEPADLTTISYDLLAAEILGFIRRYAVHEDYAVSLIATYLRQAHRRGEIGGEIAGMQRYDRILTDVVDSITGRSTTEPPQVSCSHCGRSFRIPGRMHGFSTCAGHSGISPLPLREEALHG